MDPPPGVAGDLIQAITVLRARVDEEFRITERLDGKMRQAFALAAGFFAVVQTVAFGGFAQDNVNPAERALIGGFAALAGVCLIVVAHRLTNGEELHEEADLRPEAIVDWCNEADSDDYVSVRLVRELGRVARERSDNNVIRGSNYDAVAQATRWALIFAGVELLVAIALRI